MNTKLTPDLLKALISEEKEKMLREIDVDAKETDASDYADSLANKIDYMKKLGIAESNLKRKLQAVEKVRSMLKEKIVGDL
jgi:hypothetical protein|tara:strand:- start:10518 stop:10760 length:243 start_codon:yes stop_codon:yes gene_type:complete